MASLCHWHAGRCSEFPEVHRLGDRARPETLPGRVDPQRRRHGWQGYARRSRSAGPSVLGTTTASTASTTDSVSWHRGTCGWDGDVLVLGWSRAAARPAGARPRTPTSKTGAPSRMPTRRRSSEVGQRPLGRVATDHRGPQLVLLLDGQKLPATPTSAATATAFSHAPSLP
jgi:hypothetical protein